MNINRYTINSLLKFTLTFGIVLSIVNSSSAPASADNCKTSELTEEEKKDTTVSKESLTTTKNDLINCFVEKIDLSTKKIQEDFQKEIKENLTDEKLFSHKNSLLFIDLPILATLLLFWFLTQKKQQEQIDRFTKNQNKILGNFSQFNEITNKLNNLDQINRQIIGKIQDNHQKIIDSEARLHELLSEQQFSKSVNHHNSLTSDISNLSSIAIVDQILQFVETYNQDKNLSPDRIITTVKSTQENVEQRRTGNIDIVTLENTTQKKYWIIKEDNDHYLVPHAKIKIDEYNRTTLESLFDCTNFTSEYSDFQLVKPAKVSQLSSQTWQLEEKGKLNFY